jgi:competence protein ComEC
MLVGAAALLAWNPYVLLDPGFQLSFTAVAAIFWLAPPITRRLAAAGVPAVVRELVAISTACSIATAPVVWIQFQALPLLAVPANALAGPAVAPLLGCALLAAALHPVLPSAAAALAWLAGWCAAWIALVARVVGGLPFAQVTSPAGALAAVAVTLLAGAYAWRRWRTS